MAQDLINAKLKPGITEGVSLYKNQSAEIDISSYLDLKRITGEEITYPFIGNPNPQDGGVLAGKTVSKISLGAYHAIVLNTDGSLAGFGDNSYGQVSNLSSTSNLNPVEVNTIGALSLENITTIKCDKTGICSHALSSDGDFFGWGRLSEKYSSSPVLRNAGVLDFATAGNNSTSLYTVIRKEGGLFYNRWVGMDQDEFLPLNEEQKAVLSGKTITQLEGYAKYVYALCSDGTIFRGDFLSDYSDYTWQSVTMSGALIGKTVTRLVGCIDRMFAFCSDGTVAGLGTNTYGKLGNGNAIGQPSWVAVSLTGALLGKTITDVAAGYDHTLFLCSDSTIAATGRNPNGQLGNGTTLNSTTAVKVFDGGYLNGKTPIAIAAGAYHSAAVTSDGNIFTWGSDNYGQLGNGQPLANSSIPVPVLKDSFTKYSNHVRFTSSNLPDGLSFDGNLVRTAKIIGTPTTSGTTNVLIKVDLSDFTLYNPIPESGNIYETEGTTYLTVPFVVAEPPTTLPPLFSSIISNEDVSTFKDEDFSLNLFANRNLSWSQWRVSGLPPGLLFNNYNNISGTLTTNGEFVITITLDYRADYNSPILRETKTITITVGQGLPVVNLNGLNILYNGSVNVLSTTPQQGKAFSLQINASNNPESFAATGLPPGLTISNSGLVSGTPTTPGTYLAGFSATNDVGTSQQVTLRMDVTEITVPTFLNNGGVDIFFDLQSRTLSLTPPKPEATVAAGSQVVNKLEASKLIVKTGETLWLNLRFTKGTTPLDPEATGLRFGVAGKVGGPLLMEGSDFTKFGNGAAAYYRMRVSSVENEFGAIIDDYYDDDTVEQISDAKEKEAGASGEIEGLCEVVLTTGSGATIADLKSDTLGVTVKRSLFSA